MSMCEACFDGNHDLCPNVMVREVKDWTDETRSIIKVEYCDCSHKWNHDVEMSQEQPF